MEKTLKELCYLLEDELKKIVDKQDLSPEELESVNKALKVMIKTKEYESMMHGNYDRPQGYYMGMHYPTAEWNARGNYERPQGKYGYHSEYHNERPQGNYDYDERYSRNNYGNRSVDNQY